MGLCGRTDYQCPRASSGESDGHHQPGSHEPDPLDDQWLQGQGILSLLPPGSYRLTVELQGFRKHIQRFDLRVNQRAYVEVQLQEGSLDEEVVVVAERALYSEIALLWGR